MQDGTSDPGVWVPFPERERTGPRAEPNWREGSSPCWSADDRRLPRAAAQLATRASEGGLRPARCRRNRCIRARRPHSSLQAIRTGAVEVLRPDRLSMADSGENDRVPQGTGGGTAGLVGRRRTSTPRLNHRQLRRRSGADAIQLLQSQRRAAKLTIAKPTHRPPQPDGHRAVVELGDHRELTLEIARPDPAVEHHRVSDAQVGKRRGRLDRVQQVVPSLDRISDRDQMLIQLPRAIASSS